MANANKKLISALQTTHGQEILDWLTDEYLLCDFEHEDPSRQAGHREVVIRLRHYAKPRSEP